MEVHKDVFTLEEAAQIIRLERDGQPLSIEEAVKWLLDAMLNIFEQQGDSLLLPSYEFKTPVEIWPEKDKSDNKSVFFSGVADIWIEGKEPRNRPGIPPGMLDLNPGLHMDLTKHGDYVVTLHHYIPGKPQEYPLIRLVYPKMIRESEIVVRRDNLEMYAMGWGLDDVLGLIGYRDFIVSENGADADQDALESCISKATALRKMHKKISKKDLACRLRDNERFTWGIIGRALDKDPHRKLSDSAWSKNGIRMACREGMALEKKSIKSQ